MYFDCRWAAHEFRRDAAGVEDDEDDLGTEDDATEAWAGRQGYLLPRGGCGQGDTTHFLRHAVGHVVSVSVERLGCWVAVSLCIGEDAGPMQLLNLVHVDDRLHFSLSLRETITAAYYSCSMY